MILTAGIAVSSTSITHPRASARSAERCPSARTRFAGSNQIVIVLGANVLMRSAATLPQRSTKIDIFLTCRIACVTVFQNETNGAYSVSCSQEIPHVVAARDGPDASWPGFVPATHAFRRRERRLAAVRSKRCFATRQRRCLHSSLRRRDVDGRDKPGQDGRGSETRRKQPANS